ncbi:hypothetical protein BOTBODRAFT_555615 [Botryobasidium botryosum FD-172 SS1]|uniref:Zn(2)-C6 fungal-type domain-containing protein n=1 Tax=Botryobasidium botryosum (strain FD-172 SS1) TaxID=930990 RepID=A0A067LZI5_BOTB1|nr:hypothetical protein BOTBODRAFT_555615 [Botryobasidium botryosum FD-172 SS1]
MPAAHVETARMHHELARGPLKRGAACLKCRKYKLKCDGVKPTCSTCARRVRHADEPCEYESGPRKSRTQSLNDKIKILERDIQLLESSKSSKEPESPPRSESPPPITDDYGARLPKIRQTDPHGYVKSLYRNTSHGLPKFLRKEILPDCVRNHLLTIFLSRRGQCTLQFHVKRFLDSLELPPEQGPHPALLNAMYLIACHFSTSRTLSGCETLFLSRVQKHLAQALAHSDRLFDFILAAGLLSRYYSFKGRLLEAHSTGVTVTRFALGCGLHKIKTREWKKVAQESEKTRTQGRALLIPQPKDSVELGERINAFWMLYINDRIISIGTGLPNAISDDDIETVWPAPMEAFESHTASDTEAGTIRSLYTPAFRASTACLESLEALRAMGVALVDRASWVSTHADYG